MGVVKMSLDPERNKPRNTSGRFRKPATFRFWACIKEFWRARVVLFVVYSAQTAFLCFNPQVHVLDSETKTAPRKGKVQIQPLLREKNMFTKRRSPPDASIVGKHVCFST